MLFGKKNHDDNPQTGAPQTPEEGAAPATEGYKIEPTSPETTEQEGKTAAQASETAAQTSETAAQAANEEIVTHEDGSRSRIVDNGDGTRTHTVENADGTVTEYLENADGTFTQYVENGDGTFTQFIVNTDGTYKQYIVRADGSYVGNGPDETPQTPGDTPQAPEETPQTSDETTQAPDETTQAPDETTQTSDETTQAPDETPAEPPRDATPPSQYLIGNVATGILLIAIIVVGIATIVTARKPKHVEPQEQLPAIPDSIDDDAMREFDYENDIAIPLEETKRDTTFADSLTESVPDSSYFNFPLDSIRSVARRHTYDAGAARRVAAEMAEDAANAPQNAQPEQNPEGIEAFE